MKFIKKFMQGATMLAFCSFFAKVLGAFYRIPLVYVLGSEGIGLYHMIFPLYTFLITISGSGVSTAIANITAQDKYNKKKILFLSMIILFFISLCLSLIVVFLAPIISNIQGKPNAYITYFAIAPAIIFVTIISGIRGFYQGQQDLFPYGMSQIIEQVIKLFFGIYLAKKLSIYGVVYSVTGALLGITFCEIAALLFLFFYTFIKSFINKIKISKQKNSLDFEMAEELIVPSLNDMSGIVSNVQIIKEIYKLAIPVTIGAIIIPFLQLVDSIFVVKILSNHMSLDVATIQYGLLMGPVSTLLNLPTVITIAFTLLNLPKIISYKKNNKNYIELINSSLKLNFVLAFGAFLTFMVFSFPFIQLVYGHGLNSEELNFASFLLQINSINVLFIALIQSCSVDLQAVSKAYLPLLALGIGAIFKLLFTYLLLNHLLVFAVAFGNIFCFGITAVLDCFFLKHVFKDIDVFKFFLISACLICLSILFAYIIYIIILPSFNEIISMIIGGIFGIVFLFFLFYRCGLLNELMKKNL